MFRIRNAALAVITMTLMTSCAGFFPSDSDLDSIDLSPTELFLVVGDTFQLTATGRTVGGETKDVSGPLFWSSSNNRAATVDSTGTLKAVSSGTGIAVTTVTASTRGVSARTSVVVADYRLTSVTITPSSPSIAVGATVQLVAVGKFEDNSTSTITEYVAWASSDISIATVTPTGAVQGVAAGTATITVTTHTSSGTVTSFVSVSVSKLE